MNIKKAFPSKWLKSEDLGQIGASVQVQIEKVQMEKLGDDEKPTLYFYGKKKAMPLNITNSNLISDTVGLGWDTDQWTGHTIELYVTTDRAPGGGTTECIRIRKPTGAQQPVSPPPPPQGQQPPQPQPQQYEQPPAPQEQYEQTAPAPAAGGESWMQEPAQDAEIVPPQEDDIPF